MLSNDLCCALDQFHNTSFFSRLCNVCTSSLMWGRNKIWLVIHGSQEASDLSYIFWGRCMFYCFYLRGINLQPFFGDLVSHKWYCVYPHDNFVLVQTYPELSQHLWKFFMFSSCSSSFFPWIMMSSAMQIIPWRFSETYTNFIFNISADTANPKGSLIHLNLPKQVWNIVNLHYSSSSFLCQYHAARSALENTSISQFMQIVIQNG